MPITRNTEAWEKEDKGPLPTSAHSRPDASAPDVTAFVAAMPAIKTLLDGDHAQMRATINSFIPPENLTQDEEVEVSFTKVNGMHARQYEAKKPASGKRPCVIAFVLFLGHVLGTDPRASFHGGGFVVGHPGMDDVVGIGFAKQGAIVFSPDYRMAPEHEFPASHEDAASCLDWILQNADKYNIDTSKIVVYGMSAGANLAAGFAQHARDKGVQLAGQLLRVPWVCAQPAWPKEYTQESHAKFTNTVGLREADMHKFYNYYASKADPKDPRLSPLLGNLKGLAPAYIEICGIDRPFPLLACVTAEPPQPCATTASPTSTLWRKTACLCSTTCTPERRAFGPVPMPITDARAGTASR
jgi:acetyl esterase/lipase